MSDESIAIAKRIPFKMVLHMNCGTEHIARYRNEKLRIECETVTPYRNGQPAKGGSRIFYAIEKDSQPVKKLSALLDKHDDIRELAATLYPEQEDSE